MALEGFYKSEEDSAFKNTLPVCLFFSFLFLSVFLKAAK